MGVTLRDFTLHEYLNLLNLFTILKFWCYTSFYWNENIYSFYAKLFADLPFSLHAVPVAYINFFELPWSYLIFGLSSSQELRSACFSNTNPFIEIRLKVSYKIVQSIWLYGCFLLHQEFRFTFQLCFAGKWKMFNICTFVPTLVKLISKSRFIYVRYASGLLKEGLSLLHWLTLTMMTILCINTTIIYPLRFDN